MKIKNVKLITEEARDVGGITFLNSTDDQFPYVESALNSLDNNMKWWKDNWPELEQLIAQYLEKALSDNFEHKQVKVASRFTVFHGSDEKSDNVVWTGPAIVYSFIGATPEVVRSIKTQFGGIYEGKKIFADQQQLIFLFG